MPERAPAPKEAPELKKEKEEEEKNIVSLVENEKFRRKLEESAKITYKLGHESGFNWILRKDGKIETSKVLEGATAEMPPEKDLEIKRGDISFFRLSQSKGWEKALIYGDIHFHPATEKEEILPSESDLMVFTVLPEEVATAEEIDKKYLLYLKNFWRGIGIVKEDKSLDLLLINGKIGPTDRQLLYEELEETKGFQNQLELFRNYSFKLHYFENISKLRGIKE